MTPDSFEFTVTMPGDPRLIAMLRGLVTQAAAYAQLTAEAAAALADEVERAAETALAATDTHDAPIEFRFSGDEEAITVRISSEAATHAERPRSSAAAGVSVEWSADGPRLVCHVRQPIPA